MREPDGSRVMGVVLVCALVVMVVVAMWKVASTNGADTTTTATTSEPLTVTVQDPAVARLRRRLAASRRRTRQLALTLRHQPSVREAITLACHTYGSCQTLWRRARCESGLDARAYNPSGASGLYQFMPGTFHSTPYGSESIWSPYANAMAAGWMQAHGRGSEWVCR